MAKQLVLQNLMKLAQGIGANPQKFMGTRTNISFLGKGPTKNPLFQGPLRGLESASEAQLGPRETIIEAVEDAMGFASANKLNSIQIRALELNLEGLFKIYNPPPLPMASISPIRSGIRTLRSNDIGAGPRRYNELTGLNQPRAVDLPQKTASARATMIRLLDVYAGGKEGVGVTLREIMSPQELKWLMEGGGGATGDPLALFAKYYGSAATRGLPTEGTPAVIDSFAKRLLRGKDSMGRKVDDPFFDPDDAVFAHGGLAHVLQVPRSGYSKGRMVKGALAILNRNKKNAEYMFKASDNVSPGYAKGDMKYNAELLADQLAEDAGVVYNDLGDLERIKFYGTAYDYLAKEMGMMLQMQKDMKNIVQVDALTKWNPKGRKPNASGGLARILEV